MRRETGGGRYEVLTADDIWPANFTFYERLKRRQLKPLTAETRAAAAHLVCFLVEKGHKVSGTGRRRRARARSYGDTKMRVHIAHLASFLSDGVYGGLGQANENLAPRVEEGRRFGAPPPAALDRLLDRLEGPRLALEEERRIKFRGIECLSE